jgi:hypothetical protein
MGSHFSSRPENDPVVRFGLVELGLFSCFICWLQPPGVQYRRCTVSQMAMVGQCAVSPNYPRNAGFVATVFRGTMVIVLLGSQVAVMSKHPRHWRFVDPMLRRSTVLCALDMNIPVYWLQTTEGGNAQWTHDMLVLCPFQVS